MNTSLPAVSRAAFAVLAASMAVLVLKHQLFGTGPVTIGLQVLAAGLMVWARLTFGWRSFHAGAAPTRGGLVTTGPYARVRHPIYAAILLFVWAGLAAHPSWFVLAATVVATGAVAVRIAAEERLLTGQYPGYRQYAAGTKRLIPFVM